MSVQKIPSTPLVKINNVSYRNGSEVILDNISFEINRGDFLVGVIGPNGEGENYSF